MQNRRNLTILFATLVIMMMGFGIIIPILPDLVVAFGGSGLQMGGLMASPTATAANPSSRWACSATP